MATITEAIKCKNECLAGIKKKQGEQVLVASLILMIDGLVKFFSVGKTMNSYQLGETARLLANEFYFLKVEDLHIFFERMKSGYYGQAYDRIDGNVIMVNLRSYCEERITTAENLSLEAHKTAIEEERKENYLIQIGEAYLRSDGDGFIEVEEKELATGYTYGVAIRLRDWIVREQYPLSPESIKVIDKNKLPRLFDLWEKDAPELLPPDEKFKRATADYYEQKRIILANERLNDLQKENAIRSLAKLEPITQEEFNEQNKYYKQ